MADSKKQCFSKSPILNIFLWNFYGSVLGLVRLIDAKGIDVAQPIWPWAQKQAKNAFFVFLGRYWAYVGQPHNHIGWATSMFFAPINTANPRTNPWNFGEIFSRIGSFENLSFFE